MAIRVPNDNFVELATPFADGFSAGAYTVMALVKPTTLTGGGGLLFCGNGPNWPNGDWCSLGSGANEGVAQLVSFSNSSGAGSSYGSESFSTSVWTHVAMVRTTATNLRLYVNGILDVDFTTTSTASRFTGDGNVAFNTGDIPNLQSDWQAFKVWERALSQPEIIREMRQTRAVSYANLRVDAPIRGGSEAVMFANEVEGETDLNDDNYGSAVTALYTNAVAYDLRQGSTSVVESAAGGGVTVTPGTAALTLTAQTPTVTNPVTVTPGVASLTITAQAPTVSNPVTVTPGIASLTATAQTPTTVANATQTPGVATLILTAQTPTVSNPVTVTPGVASLTATAQTPATVANATQVPGVATLTLTAQTPTVTTDNNVTVVPGVATLTLTAQAPTQVGNATQTPGIATLTLTAQTPTVTVGANTTVTPGIATLTLTAQTPTLTTTANVTVTPGVASLTLTAQTPTLTATDHITLTPGVVALTISPQTPVVSSGVTLLVPGVGRLRAWPYRARIVTTTSPRRERVRVTLRTPGRSTALEPKSGQGWYQWMRRPFGRS